MKIISLWDSKLSSENIIDRGILEHGLDLKVYVRELIIDENFEFYRQLCKQYSVDEIQSGQRDGIRP